MVRRTRRNPLKYTLGTASKATGKAKSTILRAIKGGVISASKGHDGSYEIDPSELHRVFPATSHEAKIEHNETASKQMPDMLSLQLDLLKQEREREREQLQGTIDDLRSRLDRSEERVQLLLAAPPKRKRWVFW